MKPLLWVFTALLAGPALAEPVSGQGTWETTLQPRDLDDDGVADAWYDTVLDITWSEPWLVFDVNSDFARAGRRNVSKPRMSSARAQQWLDYLNSHRYLGARGWRLPHFRDVGRDGCTRGVDCGQYLDVSLSEIAHLYAVTLGNLPNCGPPPGTCPQPDGGLTNTGPFAIEPGRSGEYFIIDPELPDRPPWLFTLGTGLQKERTGGATPWAVLDGDIANAELRPPGPEPNPGDYAQLHCPGDVNLDGIADLVAVTSGGRVIARSLDGNQSSRFALEHARGLVDSQVIADTDGNGAPELVALGTSVAEVRDLQQGATRSVVDFWSDIPSRELEIIEDIDGNGYPEITRRAGTRESVLQSRDPDTGEIGVQLADRHESPVNFFSAPRAPNTLGPLLGILFDVSNDYGSPGLWSRLWGSNSNQKVVRDRYLGGDFVPLQAIALTDSGNNGLPTVAVLGAESSRARDSVRLLNIVGVPNSRVLAYADAVIRIGLGVDYTAQQILAAPDINSNGAADFVVYEIETGGTRHRARIHDGRTGDRLATVRFSEQLTGIDLAVCPDLDDNGAIELALLSRRHADGGVRVLVKDTATDEVTAAVSFP